MSRKHALPNVDEEALAALARQFPSMNPPPAEARDAGQSGLSSAPASPDPASAGSMSYGFAAERRTPEPAERPEPSPRPDADKARGRLAADDAPPAASARPPGRPERPRRRGGRLLASLALLIAVVALAVGLGPAAPPQVRDWLTTTIGDPTVVDILTGSRAREDAQRAALAEALKGAQDQAARLATRLDAIEAVGGSSAAAARRVDALEAAAKAADARMAALESSGRAADEKIAALGGRGDAAEAALDENAKRTASLDEAVKTTAGAVDGLAKAGKAQKLLLTMLHLRSASQQPGPFVAELAAARAAVGDDDAALAAALKTLSASAQTGVATMQELQDSFAKLIGPRVLALSSASQQGLTDRTKAWVQSMFVSRASDDVAAGGRNERIVALAERSLTRGQLAPAVDQIALLEDEAAVVATEWLRNASARLNVDKATAMLVAQAFDRMAGAK
jgi:hypothetical protein